LNFTSEEVEIPVNNLIIDYNFTFLIDTVLIVDSIWYHFNNNEGLTVSENSLELGILHGEQPLSHQLNLSFNHQNTPYYLQELQMFIRINGKVEMQVVSLYFTPWSTVQIFSQGALPQYFKIWHVRSTTSTIPHRVEISPDTLPEPPDTTLPICWQSIPGLGYDVAVNCDTSEPTTEYWRTFKGTAIGKVEFQYTNQDNIIRNLSIAHAKVEVLCNNNVAATGQTDANGNYSIYYEYRSWLNTSGNVDVKVLISTKDNDHNSIEVKVREPALRTYHLGNVVTHINNHNISNNHNVFNFGTIQVPFTSHLSIYHWARRSLDFAKTELNVYSAFLNWHPLVLQVDLTPSTDAGCYFRGGGIGSTIKLGRMPCLTDESTTYHEMGHYVQYIIQEKRNAPNIGGTHTERHNNAHPNQTISEGFATGFGMMVDARYHLDDVESFRTSFIRAVHPRTIIFPRTHPFTNEAHFANSLFDLWDDVNKLESYGLTPDFAEVRLIHDFDNGENQDEISLPFHQIITPFLYNRSSSTAVVQDVLQYFGYLTANVNNCKLNGKIKNMVDYNFQNPNYIGVNVISGALFRVNTDFISLPPPTIFHRNDDVNVNFPSFYGPTPQNYNYPYNNSIDIGNASFTTATGSFNSAIGLNVPNQNLTDDLTLTDNTELRFNNNLPIGWVNDNSPVRPPSNSNLVSDICGATITVENGSSIVVGDATVNTTAVITADGGARINLESGATLRINNNSKLIIGSEASLNFEDGANIVLNGPNSILEINGQLIIGNNATFTFTGDGFIKTGFYPCLNCDNILTGTNSSILLQGNGKQDKVLEVADGTNFEAGAQTQSLVIQNGKIEMGSNSILHARGADFNFQNLAITAKNSSNKFGSVMLNGNPDHFIKNVDISYAKNGIDDRQIYGGGSLLLTDVNLQNCNIGLRTNGNGATLINCNFQDNATSWQNIMGSLNFNSRVNNSTFTGNTEDGIYYVSGGGNLELNSSTFVNNYLSGVHFDGNGTLKGKCNTVVNNGFAVSSFTSAILDFDNGSTNDFSDNIVHNFIFFNARALQLNDGNNNLKGISANALKIILGEIQQQTPFNVTTTVQANGNNWQFLNTPPIQNDDYILEATYTPAVGQPITQTAQLTDNNPTAFNTTSCYEVVTNPGYSDPFSDGGRISNCPNCPIINTPNFASVKLNDALIQTQNELALENADLALTFNKLIEITTVNFESPTATDLLIQASAYNNLKEVYAQMITEGLIDISKEFNAININDGAQSMLDVMNFRSTRPYFNNIQSNSELVYHTLEKASLYYGLSRKELALVELASIKTIAQPKELEYINSIECYIQKEQQLLGNEITYVEYENLIQECAMNVDMNELSLNNSSIVNNNNEDAFAVTIFPNPTEGTFTFTAEDFNGASLTVQIFNSSNQLLFNNNYTSSASYVNQQIELSNLSSGVYNMHLISNDAIVVRQIVVQ